MKFLVITSILATTSAFSPASMQGAGISNTALSAEVSRQNFIGQSALLLGSLVSFPMAGSAAKYGSFGAGSPLVIDAKDAEVDQEILASAPVQKAVEQANSYQATVREMLQALSSDPQTNVKPYIVKNLDFSSLRETLNVVNTALEEDSQRGTDRLIRVIMQDITELELANKQKDGAPRSPRRLEIMQGKLNKLDKAFSDYLAFTK
mmetsp:Transcript_6919/g.8977  ORF Transcript_6919/g.8977 Transcript_6919/m.8977 type:complete len:206 (-) Transcript_6919:244-861(-)|eukprot:CAMPEP_0198137230 /NCGR_PEP_ID=MMETSP1443-20131203/751_1 /TAXON_ID=186043 /ORGANISM="Entomoneis sp., Strain CCMP2396" /LENGTH=205 /DNA_ID=CAMNT_0043798593 /DNA_START=57 /DNA_END=674 /DNA_ORIENTATION=-